MPSRGASALLALAIVAPIALVGCATGERPTLGPTTSADPAADAPTGVDAVDAMLSRLDAADDATFQATYSILRKLGSLSAEAVVAQQPPRTTVKVRDVVFVYGDDEVTCPIEGDTCAEGLEEQRLSDLGITTHFFSESPATQIRVSMARRTGEPAITSEPVGPITADCVSINVGVGTEKYCVTTDGIAALIDRADVHIEVTAYSTNPDPSLLDVAGSAPR